jgi:hypothetical protein
LALRRFPRAGDHQFTIRRREAIHHRLGGYENAGVSAVIPDGKMLLRQRIHAEAQEQIDGVFLAIHGTGGQRRLQISERHLHRIGTQALVDFAENGTCREADLQATQILGLADFALAVGDFAEAILAPGNWCHVAAGQRAEQVAPDFPIDNRVISAVIGHQEGQRKNVHFADLRGDIDGGKHRHINHALAHRDQFARLIAADQLAARIDLHIDPPAGAFRDQFRPGKGAV